MTLHVYNTLTRKKEEFQPLNGPKVNMYVCGVTVYDYSHIGHARAYIAFDVIFRYLKYKGYDVTYVRNFTDIDDKIIRRANEQGTEICDVSEAFIDAFTEDMDALGLLHPQIEPRCTENVPKMIEFISGLVEKGVAYPTPSGDVYFSIKKFPSYGKLSGRKLDDMRAGASERVEEASEKQDPFDFALWKGSKPGEPSWTSPWGEGRPGWHIECSVMSYNNLGETFDIHGGGKDLVFPHHENEIAQSEAYTGKPFAKYWLHNGFVNVPSSDGEETKMSKSLGNFYTVRDVMDAYHPQAIKFFMLSTSYRNDITFTDEGLKNSQKRIMYYYESLLKADKLIERIGGNIPKAEVLEPELVDNLITRVEAAMDDDFNTQKAIGELSEAFRLLNELTDRPKGKDKNKLRATVFALQEKIRHVGEIFGLLNLPPAETLAAIKLLQLKFYDVSVEDIEASIAKRLEARANKDWAAADGIRNELMEKGIELRDTPEGTDWTFKE